MTHADKLWIEIVEAERTTGNGDPWKVLLALAAGMDALYIDKPPLPKKEE